MRSFVKYCFYHSKIKIISSRCRAISSMYLLPRPSSSKRTKIPTHKPISMRQVTLKTERKETPYFQLLKLCHSQTTFLVTELRVSYRDRADRNGTRLYKTRSNMLTPKFHTIIKRICLGKDRMNLLPLLYRGY